MFYIGKCAQAAGLTIILVGFIKYFPDLMSYRILISGIVLYLFGWVSNRFLLKK